MKETPSASLLGLKSASARYAQHTAAKLGYTFRSLDGSDGYLFEVADGARRAHFSAGAGTPYALNAAHANAIARDKAFAQTVLAQAGLPTIPSRLFFTSAHHEALRDPGREPTDALRFADNAEFPLFLKPIDGTQGAFAEIVRDREDFARYLQRVAPSHYAILAQPLIRAPECRVFVLRGAVLFWYRKLAPTFVGDGIASLEALAHASGGDVRGADAEGAHYSARDIPGIGVRVTLEGAANRARGGGTTPPEAHAPPHLAALALACASTLRLDLAAVDLFDRPGAPLIIEVNCNPAIRTLEDHNRWDLIETIWRANFDAALR